MIYITLIAAALLSTLLSKILQLKRLSNTSRKKQMGLSIQDNKYINLISL